MKHLSALAVRVMSVGALSIALAAPSAQAQYASDYYGGPFWSRPYHFGAEFGGAIPIGNYNNNVNGGWDAGFNFAIPLGYRSPIWLQFDGNYASFGVNTNTLISNGANSGYSSLSSLTANLVFNFANTSGITPYVLGGGGIYDRYTQLDNIGGVYAGCDPYFGYCGYYGVYNVRSRSEIAGGWDAGGGLRFRMRPVQLYVEARYNSAFTNHGNTNIVPITVGVEW
jgi:hypothetical protein